MVLTEDIESAAGDFSTWSGRGSTRWNSKAGIAHSRSVEAHTTGMLQCKRHAIGSKPFTELPKFTGWRGAAKFSEHDRPKAPRHGSEQRFALGGAASIVYSYGLVVELLEYFLTRYKQRTSWEPIQDQKSISV
jgi:hypothetical protein